MNFDKDQIIAGCIKGERKSQQVIFETFYGKMMGVCLRYAKSEDEAKDILQEGFIKVFKNMKNYGDKGSFEGWIRRIIVNTAIDFHRKRNKEGFVNVESDVLEVLSENAQSTQEEEVTENDIYNIDIKEVMKEVQNLSPAYQAVFNMYVVEGYSHKEIAQKLGISEGTSKSNLAKAKRNLKKFFLKNKAYEK